MGNLNPYYNESFVFVVEQEMLRVRRWEPPRPACLLLTPFRLVQLHSNIFQDNIWTMYKVTKIDGEHSKRQQIQKKFPLDFQQPILQTQIKRLVAFECSSWLLN